MPTLEHNAIVEMFRDNPKLAPHFLAPLFHIDVPHHVSAVVLESSLDQLIPVEFRSDLVLELRNTWEGCRQASLREPSDRRWTRSLPFSWACTG